MRSIKTSIQIFLVTVACMLRMFAASADIRLPDLFADHMVLQQKTNATVWGWGAPREAIMITASWSRDTVKVMTNGEAKWSVQLPTPAAGGPYSITVAGSNKIVLKDVMIGEVWICSGQSNMEYSAALGMKDAREDLPNARNPLIRLFTVSKATAGAPQENCDGAWTPCDSSSASTFSAVGYFFAKKLVQSLHVPIGIINISWSGTPAEVWMPADSVNTVPLLAQHAYSTRTPVTDNWPTIAGRAYNGMIAPVTNFAIAGVVWYQGESNSGFPRTYKQLFTRMVSSWRHSWKLEFPFYFVQIAPYANYGPQDTAYLVREQQVACLDIPKTGMVVITDLVDDITQIHPAFKKPVGDRLASWALAETYQQKGLMYKSPLYERMEVNKNKIRIHFKNAASGLKSSGKKITEFEIAGSDRTFVPADVVIDNNTVVVSAKSVANPVAVRFAFRNGPLPNLFSKDGLPASPFRTDDW